MTAAQRAEAQSILFDLAPLFGGGCEACQEPCDSGKGYTVHHKKYDPAEKDWKDFREGHTLNYLKDAERVKYYRYLSRIIRELSPAERKIRFAFLHSKHHMMVQKLRRFKSDATIRNIARIALETDYIKPRGSHK